MHLTPDVGILVAQIALILVVLVLAVGVAVALVRVIVKLCAGSRPG